MERDDIHIEVDLEDEVAPIPELDLDARDIDDVDRGLPEPRDDLEEDRIAAVEARDEARGLGIVDDAQPETQGDEPVVEAIGEDGQGDLAPEDL